MSEPKCGECRWFNRDYNLCNKKSRTERHLDEDGNVLAWSGKAYSVRPNDFSCLDDFEPREADDER